jgi:hypothetical protein
MVIYYINYIFIFINNIYILFIYYLYIMSNYSIKKTVSSVTTTTDVCDILQTGTSGAVGTTNFSNLIGFPTCVSSSLTFEHPSTTGYKINDTDIANSICAKFAEYTGYSSVDGNTGQTIDHTVNIPTWCNSLAVIIIGAGGGGGGGGGQVGDSLGGGGGGGGSGGKAWGTVSRGTTAWSSNTNTFKVSLGGCGLPGGYQGNNNDRGYTGTNPAQTSTNFSIGTSNEMLLTANAGGPGAGGPDPNWTNEYSDGGAAGNWSYSSSTSSRNGENGNLGIMGSHYQGSGGGVGGTCNNNTTNVPVINTNKASPGQSKTTGIEQSIPGVGQGGLGGINSSNGNGYGGQFGGPSRVRVYFFS